MLAIAANGMPKRNSDAKNPKDSRLQGGSFPQSCAILQIETETARELLWPDLTFQSNKFSYNTKAKPSHPTKRRKVLSWTSENMRVQSGRRFAALDGWRGLAAMFVAAFHFGVSNHLFYLPLIRHATHFVDFFFVLSGFVLAHTYGRRVTSKLALAAYMLRRFGRLWPLHAFTLLCLVGLEFTKLAAISGGSMAAGEAPFTGITAAEAIPAHLLFLQAFSLFPGNTWNVPSWSIASEFWTYLVFGLVCLCLPRLRFLAALALILSAFLVLTVYNQGQLGASSELGFFRCLFGFFCGVVTYEVAMRAPGILHPDARTFPEIAVVVLAGAFIWLQHGLVETYPLVGFLGPLLFSLAVLVFAGEAGRTSRFLMTRPVQLLGMLSYSVYMVHYVLATTMNSGLRLSDKVFDTSFALDHKAAGDPTFAMPLWAGDLLFVAYLCSVAACSMLTWRLVEEPARLFFNEKATALSRSDPSNRPISLTEREGPV